ncbi:MAG TPA: alpha-amylase family glycosyl hydrolase [Candidatus Limnocylindrales bacterium]|nr:alpha-amylase family glycosyl hydrolase [Candidatus Limnocylindrales bacterium]
MLQTSNATLPTATRGDPGTASAGAEWWREGVLYQIYPRSFQDSNGDGIGDLRGIIDRLDYLNGRPDSLGVDGIWLSPFYPSPMHDFGYDVADYCDVDPQFGTLDDFDDLVREAHARGIRVIIDLVPNHTSSEHPWFQEARRSRDDPKRSWYVWADPAPDGGPPNNWKSAFRLRQSAAWTLDAATGQYYHHSFLPEQPDLNWWNPEVRAAFDEILRFWLDRGVDGFRIDVAHRMARDPDLRDNPDWGIGEDEHLVHWTEENAPRDQDWPEVHAILRGFRRTLDAYDARMAIGEVFLLDPARLVRYYGDHDDELHLAFNFAFLRAPWSADAFRTEVETFERLLPAGAWPDYTLSNHDNPRAVSRYADGDLERGRRRARLAALMILTLRGTPFLYYGEEIGMADGPIPAERVVDVAGRDPERTPMQWDATPSAGFTEGSAWLPVAAEAATVNVAAQLADPTSMLAFQRQLIGLRRSSAALRGGAYRTVPGTPAGTYVYLREAPAERRLIALNFGARPVRIDLGGISAGTATLVTSSDPGRPTGGPVEDSIEVGPDEGVLIAL